MTVHAVLGLAGMECTVGGIEVLRFSEVYEVFALLGMTLDQFANKFSVLPRARSPCDAKAMADAVLRSFSAETRRDVGDVLPCRDLFRLLELVGYPLKRFKTICGAVLELDSPIPLSELKFGSYRVRRVIGRGGMNGACSFLAEDPASSDIKVAIKWPVQHNELSVCKDLSAKDCLGLPKLLDTGSFEGKSYIVTELLGSPLNKLFQRLETVSSEARWRALCIVGRMVLRRLQALHDSGFVHCDVAPGNILIGKARGAAGAGTAKPLALFLIDLEHAQKCPGGRRLPVEIGSTEWSSIRSAEGGERLPEDDLEALGWVLLNGLVGPLPWFKWLTAAYRDWGSTWTKHQVVKQAQRAKQRLLESGCRGCLGWLRPRGVPEELVAFLRLCGSGGASSPGRPDYGALAALLGGDPELTTARAERYDLSQLAEHMVPLL